jgi:hypothetical protein
MDTNPTNGIGIALLWPFYNEFFSPFNLFNPSVSTAGWSQPIEMFRILIPTIIYEIPFYLISLFLLFKQRPAKSRV